MCEFIHAAPLTRPATNQRRRWPPRRNSGSEITAPDASFIQCPRRTGGETAAAGRNPNDWRLNVPTFRIRRTVPAGAGFPSPAPARDVFFGAPPGRSFVPPRGRGVLDNELPLRGESAAP
jgi:hypothetical protein